VRLLANENFPLQAVLFLRALGYDIISISEELSGITDEYVMNLANAENRIILTFDRDYGELIFKHKYTPPKGVIYLRLQEYQPDEPGAIIHKLFTEYQIETERTLTVFDGLMIRQRKY